MTGVRRGVREALLRSLQDDPHARTTILDDDGRPALPIAQMIAEHLDFLMEMAMEAESLTVFGMLCNGSTNGQGWGEFRLDA